MKKLNFIFMMFLLALLVIPACQTTSVDTRAEADAIRNLEDQWSAAVLAGDIDKILSLFASEGVEMDPNAPIFVGLQAIRKANESWFSDTTILFNTYSYKIDTIEVSTSGDLAYVRGTSRISQNTPNAPIVIRNKWIDIWKKFDGKWKVIVNIGNMDNPLAGQ